MKGKLIGVGVGPGDPELLTIKAINAIQNCDVVAVPASGSSERAAYTIVEDYLAGKALLECRFSMDRDIALRREAREAAAGQIMARLEKGEDVAFITLGDPATYSTYMYVHEIIINHGYRAEIVPGITSYAAAAASLGISLCEGDEILMVIPARHTVDLDELLGFPGNKVLMKSGENLTAVIAQLKNRGYGSRTRIASRVTMEGQRLYKSIAEYEASREGGYFSLAIVKEKE